MLEIKYKKVTAKVNAVLPRSDMHGDSMETAVTINLEFLADADFLNQLTGEPVNFKDVLWNGGAAKAVTGLAPLKFLTEFKYQKVKFKLDEHSATIPRTKIDGIEADPQDSGKVKMKLRCKFECTGSFVGQLSDHINRLSGIGVTFQGDNKELREADEEQGNLDLEEE